MPHTILIALHAATGGVAMIAGLVALLRPGLLFGTYLVALVATTVFLAAALAAEWTVLDTGARALFTAFVLLAVVMVVRGVLAGRLSAATPGYVEHVGFTLIALFDAFVVITVLNMGAPVWLVVASGVAVAVAGHFVLRLAKRHAERQAVGRTRPIQVSASALDA